MDLAERNELKLNKLEAFILDETDQMLNQGFQEDIEKILKYVDQQFESNSRNMSSLQMILFSATVPKWVTNIASQFMKPNYKFVNTVTDNENKTSQTVEHLSIFYPSKQTKISSIGDIVQVYGGSHCRCIIFTDMKSEANQVLLEGNLKVDAQVLHGDIPQTQREVTFEAFRNGKLKCLIATNVAARGLDIPQIDLIIQLSPPKEAESYIHRSGRTGRAGKSGVCITFYTREEEGYIRGIEAEAKIKFKQIGTPQPHEIVKATARDISVSFDSVADDVLSLFKDTSAEILEKYTPQEAICRAVAIMSGCTKKLKQRSLISSLDGFITYVLKFNDSNVTKHDIIQMLKKFYSPDIAQSITQVKMLATNKGAAFDIPE